MVADSHSDTGQLVLPWWAGIVVGAVTGTALVYTANIPLISAIPAILGLAILGLFFSLCANRTTILGYLLVGLFMGINCAILTKLVTVIHLDEAWPLAKEHHINWKHCLGFGEILALAALLFSWLQGRPQQKATPKD